VNSGVPLNSVAGSGHDGTRTSDAFLGAAGILDKVNPKSLEGDAVLFSHAGNGSLHDPLPHFSISFPVNGVSSGSSIHRRSILILYWLCRIAIPVSYSRAFR